MKNLKKLTAVLLAVALMATMAIVPAFAEGTALTGDAKICSDLGVLKGEGAGVTADYLAKGTTRIQSAIMYLRLLGLEDDAYAGTYTANFADAKKAGWADGEKALGYLKAHPELGWQGDGTNFDPAGATTVQMIDKVMLVALGYAEGTDFQYADAVSFAGTKNLKALASKTTITNNDFAAAIVEALKANVKAGTKTLIAQLVEDTKVITAAAAEGTGLYSTTITATAAQTGAKVITVTFNKALTADQKTAATMTLKKGLVPYTVTTAFAADNKSATLTYAYNFLAGDYTVTVGGIKDPVAVTVADEKVTKIVLSDDYLPLLDDTTIAYKVYNQFNEEMPSVTAANLTFNAFDATKGFAITVQTPATTPQLDLVTATAAKNDNVIITISHAATGVNVSKTLSVKDGAYAQTMQFSAVAPLTGKTRITAGEAGLTIPYAFVDQYGKAFKLAAHTANAAGGVDTEVISGVTFLTSDATVVDPDTFAVDAAGALTFTAGAAGTAVITAIVPSTGASATLTIKVEAAAALKTFTISAPAALVVDGETVVIPYVAADSFGAPIATKDFAGSLGVGAGQVNIVSSNAAVINPATDFAFDAKTHELKMTPTANGTATIYVYVSGALQNTVAFDVKATAIPTKVVGLVNVPTLFQIGASKTLTASNVSVIDQYNRAIKLGTIGGVAYTVAVSADDTVADKVTIANPSITSVSVNTAIAGAVAGTEKLNFTLYADAAPVANSAYSVTATAIADADIVGYSLDAVPTIYANAANTSFAAAGGYAKVLNLVGKDASGNAVTVNQAKITAVSSSDPSLVIADSANKAVYSIKAGTVTVAVYNGATKLAETSVTSSEAAPVAVSATFSTTASYSIAAAGTLDLKTALTVKDQYGATMTVVAASGTWFSSDTSNATVSNVGVVTNVSSGPSTITFITVNGIVVSVDVTCL